MTDQLLIIQLRRLRSGWMEARRQGRISDWWYKWLDDEFVSAGELLSEIEGKRGGS